MPVLFVMYLVTYFLHTDVCILNEAFLYHRKIRANSCDTKKVPVNNDRYPLIILIVGKV